MNNLDKNVLILGIESSCDETAASVVKNGREILSNVVSSQINIHEEYGGVVPEIASRHHLEDISQVVDKALRKAQVKISRIDGLAVTYGPGLIGSLLVGVSFAKAFALAWQKPLIPVHHIEGHIASCYLSHQTLEPPFLALIVSGGHASLVKVKTYVDFETIAQTRDDAPGEAFDKIARILKLGYPGGPKIDHLSKYGNPEAFKLPNTHFADSLDFSFSGLKTACIQFYNKTCREAEKGNSHVYKIISKADFAATFQHAVIKTLIDHTREAIKQTGIHKLIVSGGVSANSELRAAIFALQKQQGITAYMPDLSLCGDNGAMIAAAGYYAYVAKRSTDADFNATSVLEIDTPLTSKA